MEEDKGVEGGGDDGDVVILEIAPLPPSSALSGAAAATASSVVLPDEPKKALEVVTIVDKATWGKPINKIGRVSAEEWKHFKVYSFYQTMARCMLCESELSRGDVNMTSDHSTSKLNQHLKTWHNAEYKLVLAAKVNVKTNSGSQAGIEQFIVKGDNGKEREEAVLRWIVADYQPFSVVESPAFRAMLRAYDKKGKVLSADFMQKQMAEKVIAVSKMMDAELKTQRGAVTTDGWTSKGNHSYYAFTYHYIDSFWRLRAIPLSIRHHTGTSTAADHVQEMAEEMEKHELSWANIVALVTDTEPTMYAFGRMLIDRARAAPGGEGDELEHVGCVDHVLNTITKKVALDPTDAAIAAAADDGGGIAVDAAENGALAGARRTVMAITMSTQQSDELLKLQRENPPALPPGQKFVPVTVIQDVATRWWSTYSMCARLIRLKTYLATMVQTGKLVAHLNDAQWMLLDNITKRLKPFMLAQRFLEGEKYVTISCVPLIVTRIRTDLDTAIDNETSAYMKILLTTLRTNFRAEWGFGLPNTMYDEHLQTGPRRRHKGFRKIHMIAAFLDPRCKDLAPFGEVDKQKIYAEVKRRALLIFAELRAAEEVAATAARVAADAAAAAAAAAGATAPNGGRAGGGGGAATRRRIDTDEYVDLFNDLGAPGFGDDDEDGDLDPPLNGPDDAVKTEIKLYLKEARLARVQQRNDGTLHFNDPLLWWKDHARTFPTLAVLARRVLCVPATSAPSERLFSVAGLTIARDRARLIPETAADLIFLHDAWPIADDMIARKRTADTA
jgi:hypothetical protein